MQVFIGMKMFISPVVQLLGCMLDGPSSCCMSRGLPGDTVSCCVEMEVKIMSRGPFIINASLTTDTFRQSC